MLIQAGYQTFHSFPLGPSREVFDAEAEAALAGLKAALDSPYARLATNVWICLDNLEVASRLLSLTTGSSQRTFQSFSSLGPTWALRERLPHTGQGSVQVRWVPGHSQIAENEAADTAAKAGAAMILPSPSSNPLPHSKDKPEPTPDTQR